MPKWSSMLLKGVLSPLRDSAAFWWPILLEWRFAHLRWTCGCKKDVEYTYAHKTVPEWKEQEDAIFPWSVLGWPVTIYNINILSAHSGLSHPHLYQSIRSEQDQARSRCRARLGGTGITPSTECKLLCSVLYPLLPGFSSIYSINTTLVTLVWPLDLFLLLLH